MLTAPDIVRFDDAPPPPGASPWVLGKRDEQSITITQHDPRWFTDFEHLAYLIREALGPLALDVEHVGSTSVPGLPAKPIIDIDLTVANANAEQTWLPPLEDAGFVLAIREPWWYEHRCLTFAAPRSNLHVFSPDCPEAARHKIFRDWLRDHPEDRVRYRDAKLAAANAANAAGEDTPQYNARKQQVIREIYHRAFTAAGLLP